MSTREPLLVVSVLTYPSVGRSGTPLHTASVKLRRAVLTILKNRNFDDRHKLAIERIAQRIHSQAQPQYDPQHIHRLFQEDPILVPVPPHDAEIDIEETFQGRLAKRLCDDGLGARVEYLLERKETVRRSSRSESHERPSIRKHLNSLRWVPPRELLSRGGYALLIDDIVTSGTTLYACSSRISQHCSLNVDGLAVLQAEDIGGAHPEHYPRAECIVVQPGGKWCKRVNCDG